MDMARWKLGLPKINPNVSCSPCWYLWRARWNGSLKPGEQLPTVRALAGEIGINSMTVNKAYVLLKQEGYIYTDRRNGAHVRKEFSEARELSEKSKELLQQIISKPKSVV